MCFEANQHECHRELVIERVEQALRELLQPVVLEQRHGLGIDGSRPPHAENAERSALDGHFEVAHEECWVAICTEHPVDEGGSNLLSRGHVRFISQVSLQLGQLPIQHLRRVAFACPIAERYLYQARYLGAISGGGAYLVEEADLFPRRLDAPVLLGTPPGVRTDDQVI